jgi:hypothetical protein
LERVDLVSLKIDLPLRPCDLGILLHELLGEPLLLQVALLIRAGLLLELVEQHRGQQMVSDRLGLPSAPLTTSSG